MMGKGTRLVALVVFVVAAAAVAAYFYFRESPSGPAPGADAGNQSAASERRAERRGGGRRGRGGGAREVRVVTAKVEIRTVDNRVAAVGTSRAQRSLTLTADASGLIEEINFSAGAPVKAKDPLVVLNGEAQQLAIKLAQVKVDDTASTVRRYVTLRATNAVANVQLEQARTALAAAQAELEARQYDLRRRTIRAPFDGVMGITTLVKGDYLREGTAIATIDDRSKLLVDFDVSERFAGHIKLGQSVRATTLSLTGQVFRGEVSAIDTRIDPASRTLRVQATIPNPENLLIAGMTFSLSINIPGEQRPTFPGLAIKWDLNGAHVWRVRPDGTVERVGVTISRRDNETVSVTADLKAGDQIVIEGQDNLRPGVKVMTVSDARTQ
jgi:RND family efflux transporter MFP subunit